jgi:hypothetical protein
LKEVHEQWIICDKKREGKASREGEEENFHQEGVDAKRFLWLQDSNIEIVR